MQSKLKLKAVFIWLLIGIPLLCLTLLVWRFCTASIGTGELGGRLMLRDFFPDYFSYFADIFRIDEGLPVRIPFKMSASGKPVVKVKVGKEKEIDAVVDTGSSTTVVAVKIAEKADKIGQMQGQWGPRKVALPGDFVRLRELQISKLRLSENSLHFRHR